MEMITLNGGVVMPALGLGVFRRPRTRHGTRFVARSARGIG